MKTRQIFSVGFIAIVIAVFLAGCSTMPAGGAKFPSGFIGTWERVDQSVYTNTLTITSGTIKASNQLTFWDLEYISGDSYAISQYDYPINKGTLTLTLVDGNLEIIDEDDYPFIDYDWIRTENNWTGTWKRK